MNFTRDSLIQVLRTLQREHPRTEPHLVLARSDRRWFGSDVEPCDDGGLPAINPGPDGSCRISAADGADALHLHRHGEFIEVHLDRLDARRFPVEHVLEATALAIGTAIGGVVGAVVGGGKGALVGAILGGAAGAGYAWRPAIYFGLSPDSHVVPVNAADRGQVANQLAMYAR